jgi:hypothetical protein
MSPASVPAAVPGNKPKKLLDQRVKALLTRQSFTRYTHVLNRPGIGVKSPLD